MADRANRIGTVVLHFAYSNCSPVWVPTDDTHVQNFYNRIGALVFFEPNFPWQGRNSVLTFQQPFSLVPPCKGRSRWIRDGHNQILAFARKRSDLHIDLAFLITGRIASVGKPMKIDVLQIFKDLCIYVHHSKVTKGGIKPSKVSLTEDHMEVEVVRATSTGSEVGHSQRTPSQASEENFCMAATGSKRSVIQPTMPVQSASSTT